MNIIDTLAGKLIVSCQALPDEPMHGAHTMAQMADAAERGGAGGIIANGALDITAIRRQVSLPVIGVVNRHYPDSEVVLTPTQDDIHSLMSARPDFISIEVTDRRRPGAEELATVLPAIRRRYPELLLLAAVSTVLEAEWAQSLGFDGITTALYGHTPQTRHHQLSDNDYGVLRAICRAVNLPVFAEGGILTPAQAAKTLACGAFAVVVGGAITRPQSITERFVAALPV